MKENITERDLHFMQRALSVAERGIGLCSPNPAVGCVVVQNGKIIGDGWHEYERRDHAEIVALREAGKLAHGATAYVTLEPCSHTGRTGPCAKALIDAKIRRVVVATPDPNPLVAGRGIAMLQEAGVSVSVGTCSEKSQALNHGYARWIQTRLPFVTVKVAMSLDGRIAQVTQPAGEIFWITGPEARRAVQKIRHASDAILTGIGTVLADDPELTDRSGKARRRSLLRVVVDSQLRIPLSSKLVASAKDDVLVVTTSKNDEKRVRLEELGVRVAVVDADSDGRVNLHSMLRLLGEEQIQNLMVESGSALNTALMKAELVDALHIFVAPRLLGGDALPAFADIKPLALSSDWHKVGDDFHLQALLRDPWPAKGR